MKYKIVLKTKPPKQEKTKDEINQIIDKAFNKVVDELIQNNYLKVGK